MDVFDAVKARRSVRAYDSKPVPRDILDKILEAARLAPSAGGIQPWHFIVVTEAAKREQLARGGRFARFLVESPVVIVGCGDKKASPNWYVVDVAIAMQNMVLTATGEGLGTCWIGSFKERQVKEMLRVPENLTVVSLLALGYPKSNRRDLLGKMIKLIRKKKSLKEIVSFEEYGKSPSESAKE